MNHRHFWMTLLAAAALAACSSVPPRNAALDQARQQYNRLQTESQVSQYAAEEARRAGATLQRAELAQAAGAPAIDVEQLAYLTDRRIAIARETASGRAAQAVVANAGAERDRSRLAQRTQEADSAERKLAVSEQDGALKTAELAQARRGAQDDQDRLARRDARVESLEQQLKDMDGRRTERGVVVTLGDLQFDSGRSQLRADGSVSMSRLADFMKRNPQRRASIEGYTDSTGSDGSNQDLSDRRAHSVMAALVGLGVDANRLRASGHGEGMPIAGNDTAAGRQLNRRVEVVFASDAGDVPAR
jgi:outer membrane protein OmpA-like peptidoglycan-associated protein